VPRQTINVFGAIFEISLPLISKSKAVRQMTEFWMINSQFGGILDHDLVGVRTCRIPYNADTYQPRQHVKDSYHGVPMPRRAVALGLHQLHL
jgi:hypothetical protein